MPSHRRIATVLTLLAVLVPLAACGESDVERGVNSLEGNLDDLSRKDLREALRDAERSAESGGADAKREARELERKIERELEQRR